MSLFAGKLSLSFSRATFVAAALSVFAYAQVLSPSAPAATGIFDGLSGSWRGDGTIKWSTGETESLRCQAKYQVEGGGNKIDQELTCATDSTRLIVRCIITYKPDAGAIVGSWTEETYGINGKVSGRANVGRIQALVQSNDRDFVARVSVSTNGEEQTVTIRPEAFDVTEVFVTMKKTG